MTQKNDVTLKDVYDLVSNVEEKIEKNFVRRSEFEPIKAVVYGMVGTIVLAFLGAVVAFFIRQPILAL